MTAVKDIAINTAEIKQGSMKASSVPGASNFDAVLGAADAMTPLSTELMFQATGSSNAAAILNGAFTGIQGAAGAFSGASGGYPMASSMGGYGALSEYPGMMGSGASGTYFGGASGYKAGVIDNPSSANSVPGLGNDTGTLINSMNTNNLKLLELQATMQSNMQAWNTKSNILSADHKARMAMIEKLRVSGA